MKSRDQFLRAYDAGKEAYKTDVTKRPWWDRLIFSAVPICGLLATEDYLARHSSLNWGWRFAIAVAACCLLMALCSLALDKLRKLSGR